MSKNQRKHNKPRDDGKGGPQQEAAEERSSSRGTITAAWISLLGVIIASTIGYCGIRAQIAAQNTPNPFPAQPEPAGATPSPTASPTASATPTATVTPLPEPPMVIDPPRKIDLDLVPIINVDYVDVNTPNTLPYNVRVSSNSAYLWTYVWCSLHSGTLNDNLTYLRYSFLVDDLPIAENKFMIFKETSRNGWACQRWTTMLSHWKNVQSVKLSVLYSIDVPLYDGMNSYQPGDYRHDITLWLQ